MVRKNYREYFDPGTSHKQIHCETWSRRQALCGHGLKVEFDLWLFVKQVALTRVWHRRIVFVNHPSRSLLKQYPNTGVAVTKTKTITGPPSSYVRGWY
jgi:hypothetical protein